MRLPFTKSIENWSKSYNRQLPWDHTINPYHIWLREIILQQTRVEQGAPYYQKFIEHYPDVNALANTSVEQILKDWEGLGYYSRARNLHFAAQQLRTDYQGIFPHTFDEILKLKGVGEYTAAAIASFAFNLPYAVLDGNVFRVLSRFFGIDIPIDTHAGKKFFKQLAQECLDDKNPAFYNQAIIDFGAHQCKPTQPLCETCPLAQDCVAYRTGQTKRLPVKAGKIQKKERFFNFLVIQSKGYIVLEQRLQKDIWQKMFQFPLIESSSEFLTVEMLNFDKNDLLKPISSGKIYKQVLTHRNVYGKFFNLEVENIYLKEGWFIVKLEQLDQYSFPKIIRDYLNDAFKYIY